MSVVSLLGRSGPLVPRSATRGGNDHKGARRGIVEYQKRNNTVVKAIFNASMEVYDSTKVEEAELKRVLSRPRIDFTSILDTVSWLYFVGVYIIYYT